MNECHVQLYTKIKRTPFLFQSILWWSKRYHKWDENRYQPICIGRWASLVYRLSAFHFEAPTDHRFDPSKGSELLRWLISRLITSWVPDHVNWSCSLHWNWLHKKQGYKSSSDDVIRSGSDHPRDISIPSFLTPPCEWCVCDVMMMIDILRPLLCTW